MSKKTGDAPVELLDVADMAELLKMTIRGVRSARQRGLLPAAARIPGVGVRWRRSDVDAWLKQRFEAAARAP